MREPVEGQMMRGLVEGQVRQMAPFVEAWLAAWNAHAIDRVMAHYTDDATVQSPFIALAVEGSGGSLSGKAALTPVYAAAFRKYPALRFELLDFYAGTESVVIHYRSVNNLIAAETFWLDAAHQAKLVLCHYRPA